MPRAKPKRILLAILVLYLVLDLGYIVKSALGIDLLGPQFGHHGWMFVGADWLTPRLRAFASPH